MEADKVLGDSRHIEEALANDPTAISPEAERRLVRKIDFRIVPAVWLMFMFSNLDRSNIGNAYSGGMMADLHMTSTQYSVALLVFFIGYCLGEIPSNMVLSRVRPSIYLPSIIFVWGCVAMALAASKNYQSLAGIRAVLGLAESGFSPGVIFFLSSWYKPNELARRFCLWWLGSPMSGAIGGILAGAIIGNLNGVRGLHGWQWLFIIEGLATVCAACLAFMRRNAIYRVMEGGMGLSQDVSREHMGHWESFKAAMKDWRTYVFTFLYTMATGALTITYFIPTLVGSLGYKGTTVQYMTVPIYMTCVVCILPVCFLSDIRNERGYHLAACGMVSAVSFAVIMGTTNHIVQYVFLCFAAAGIWCCCPLVLIWVSNVVVWPPEKRAIAQAAVNAAGNAASIYGAFLWPSTDAPRYFPGFGTTLAFLVAISVGAIIMKLLIMKYPYPAMPEVEEHHNAQPGMELGVSYQTQVAK